VGRVLGATAAALLLLSLAPAPAGAGKRTVPARIAQARYVALGYDLGDRFLSESAAIANPDVLPEERRALQAIHDDIERWGKYIVVVKPEDAELFIALRIGRHGSVGGRTIGGGVSNGAGGYGGAFDRNGGVRRGGSYNAEISSNQDMLTVYDALGGRTGAQLWRVMRSGGLTGDPPRLYQEFRTDVERTPEPEKRSRRRNRSSRSPAARR